MNRLYRPGAHAVLAAMLLALLLGGCAVTPRESRSPLWQEAGAPGACARLFQRTDAVVDRAGVRDAGSFRLAGFPWLRVDRFLASFGDEPLGEAAFQRWVARMRVLDRQARRAELNNLPDPKAALGEPVAAALARLDSCAALLTRVQLADGAGRQALREAAVPQDEYSTLGRALGLYPITRFAVLYGVAAWQAGEHAAFRSGAPPDNWGKAYRPPSSAGPPKPGWDEDALGVPVLTGPQEQALFRWYAPVFSVAQQSPADRPGAPYWRADGPAVDATRARVYTRISHVRWQGQVLPQLNYVIWFDARPPKGRLDLLAGRLDGLNLRITLRPDGGVLLVDSIHNCGCYHRYFPGPALRLRADPDYAEPPLVHPPLEWNPQTQRLVVGLAAGSHYIRRLGGAERGALRGEAYDYADYQTLRSLPAADGGRSLFDAHGLVPGTERAERWFFWPTGVPEPGAMRQWGRHVTGFVGRRHFDDPDLLERIFQPAPPTGSAGPADGPARRRP